MHVNSIVINMTSFPPRAVCDLRRNDQGGAISNLGTRYTSVCGPFVASLGVCGGRGKRRNGHQAPSVWDNRNSVTSQRIGSSVNCRGLKRLPCASGFVGRCMNSRREMKPNLSHMLLRFAPANKQRRGHTSISGDGIIHACFHSRTKI